MEIRQMSHFLEKNTGRFKLDMPAKKWYSVW
jgi:hypothetical protein